MDCLSYYRYNLMENVSISEETASSIDQSKAWEDQSNGSKRRSNRRNGPASPSAVGVDSLTDDGQATRAAVETPAKPRTRRRRAPKAVVGAPVSHSEEAIASSEHLPVSPSIDTPPVATPMEHYAVPTTHRPFAHPSEDEFTHLLDFYGVKWLYEPRSFPLRWDGERVAEMFTPDFYLPELDLYVELTTLKQSLVTEKNRKMRHLRELYPDVNVKLLYRRDIHRLLAKYGFGPLVQEDVPEVERVLFTKPQIERRVRQIGKAISRDHKGKHPVLLGVLRGVFCFMADLMREITLPLSMDFMSVSYYGGNGNASGNGAVQVKKGPDVPIEGRHVVLVEDIVDTGMTLNYLLRYLHSLNPADVKVCALLDKKVRRLVDVKLDYVGFEIEDEFVVGYGLDYLEKYRNLPFIGILKPGEQAQPTDRKTERKRKRGGQKRGVQGNLALPSG